MKNRIKPENIGVRIDTLDMLCLAADHEKAVIMLERSGRFSRRMAAAWVQNFNGRVLNRKMKLGIFLYVKNSKKVANEKDSKKA
jgi:protein involved in temperature-dependent protein secretion